MTKDFQKINIPKLPVFTTEDGIKTIKNFFGKLIEWKNLDDLIPKNFQQDKKNKRTGKVYASKDEFQADVLNPNTDTTSEDFRQDLEIKVTKVSMGAKTKK